jgi:hypothetical protein
MCPVILSKRINVKKETANTLLFATMSTLMFTPTLYADEDCNANDIETTCTGDQTEGISIFSPFRPSAFQLTQEVIIKDLNKDAENWSINVDGRGGIGFLNNSAIGLTADTYFAPALNLSIESQTNIRTLGNSFHAINVSALGANSILQDDGFQNGGDGSDLTLDLCLRETNGSNENLCTLADTPSFLSTDANFAYGIFAQSQGGAGINGDSDYYLVYASGNRGGRGGAGGDISVQNNMDISTQGDAAHGIYTQSNGGQGGLGGDADGATYGEAGEAGPGGIGGNINIGNLANISINDQVQVFVPVPNFTLDGVELVKVFGPNGDGSHGIYAQSNGGEGGDGGDATYNFYSEGGEAGSAGSAGDISINNAGNLTINGANSRGIFAETIGGGSGTGGDTLGVFSVGGDGSYGGAGGNVNITNKGGIDTRGVSATAIFAQSVGGGGGNGGGAVAISGGGLSVAIGGNAGPGGDGGKVEIYTQPSSNINPNVIATSGDSAHGIFAQSVGGGGGTGGYATSVAVSTASPSFALAIGGSGGEGGNGGALNGVDFAVKVGNQMDITTNGFRAYGILAQSVGGGGGDGGSSVAVSSSETALGVSIGGSGGEGGSGDDVLVTNTARIETQIQKSHGILAQSVGGGGGNGGSSTAAAAAPAALSVTVGGTGGTGGTGGYVEITNQGDIITNGAYSGNGPRNISDDYILPSIPESAIKQLQLQGDAAIGMLAQSIGGGGGNAGSATAISIAGGEYSSSVSVAVGGNGGNSNTGGIISVKNEGLVNTKSAKSYGILAQSIGGGGGVGGSSTSVAITASTKSKLSLTLAAAVGGDGGDGSTAQTVTVLNQATASVITEETNATGIFAQSIGGSGGVGGASFSAALGLGGAGEAKGHSLISTITVGGSGGYGGTSELVDVTNRGIVQTSGSLADGILAQSVGGGGGAAGDARGISFKLRSTYAKNKSSGQNGELSVFVGGNGGDGNVGGKVNVVNEGTITTFGAYSRGILAQSIGGGGGKGGMAARGTGIDELDYSLFALSLLLGDGNKFAQSQLYNHSFFVGGDGGINGHSSTVDVTNSGNISTWAQSSSAILAQSIGGGGGIAQDFYEFEGIDDSTGDAGTAVIGATGKFGLGGKGGAAGNGNVVTVTNSGTLFTLESQSHGIFAQSIGGGGGLAGTVDRAAANAVDITHVYKTLTIDAESGFGLGLAIGKDGGLGGNGDAVNITNSGTITTNGDDAYGIYAQSIGGGGGQAGTTGNLESPVLLSFSGSAGYLGSAGIVTVTNSGNIRTIGRSAHGILAQASGGSAAEQAQFDDILESTTQTYQFQLAIDADAIAERNAALGLIEQANTETEKNALKRVFAEQLKTLESDKYASLISFYQNAGSMLGDGGDIIINHAGNITTTSINANAILTQSSGETSLGDVTVNLTDGRLSSLSDTVNFVDGLRNTLSIGENASVRSALGNAVNFNSGHHNTIENKGIIDGSIVMGNVATDTTNATLSNTFTNFGSYLGGNIHMTSASNQIENMLGGTFIMPESIIFDGGGTLLNHGWLSPGGDDAVQQSTLSGNFTQSATGTLLITTDFATSTSDQITVNGIATLDGAIKINNTNVSYANGQYSSTILTSTNDIIGLDNIDFIYDESAIINYELSAISNRELALMINVDFAPSEALSVNSTAFANYVNAVQSDEHSQSFALLTQQFIAQTNVEDLEAAYESLSAEPLQVSVYSAMQAKLQFSDAMHSCKVRDGDFRFVGEGECIWGRVTTGSSDFDASANSRAVETTSHTFAQGMQSQINDNWHIGYGISIDNSSTMVGNNVNSSDLNGTSIDGTQYSVGLITKYQTGASAYSFSIDAGYGEFDNIRHSELLEEGALATSTQTLSFASAHGRMSYDIEGDAWYLRPLLDVGITQIQRDGFKEEGAGATNLIVDDNDNVLLTVQPRLEFGTEFSIDNGTLIRPYGVIGVTHYAADQATIISSTLEAAPISTDRFRSQVNFEDFYADYSVGLDIISVDGLVFRLSYTGQTSDLSQSHSGSLKVSFPL